MFHQYLLRNCKHSGSYPSKILQWCKRESSVGIPVLSRTFVTQEHQHELRRRSVVCGNWHHVNCLNAIFRLEHRRHNSSVADLPGDSTTPDVAASIAPGIPATPTPELPGDPTIYIPLFDELAYEFIDYIHLQSNLSWGWTIIASTIALRTVLHLPVGYMTQRVMARMENVQPQINGHVEVLMQQMEITAKEKKWKAAYKLKQCEKGVRRIISYYHERDRCSPVRFLIPVIAHVTAWGGMTMALGQMAGGTPAIFGTEMDVDFIPEFFNQGPLWLSNLTVPDPYFILPAMLFMSNLVLIEMWNLQRGPETKTHRRMKILMRGVSLALLPAAVILPASIQLFWLTSSLCGVGQFLLLKQPAVRRFLGIPKSPSEMSNPLKEMRHIFKARYFSKKIF